MEGILIKREEKNSPQKVPTSVSLPQRGYLTNLCTSNDHMNTGLHPIHKYSLQLSLRDRRQRQAKPISYKIPNQTTTSPRTNTNTNTHRHRQRKVQYTHLTAEIEETTQRIFKTYRVTKLSTTIRELINLKQTSSPRAIANIPLRAHDNPPLESSNFTSSATQNLLKTSPQSLPKSLVFASTNPWTVEVRSSPIRRTPAASKTDRHKSTTKLTTVL